MILVPLLLVAGYLLSTLWIKDARALERTAYTLLFAATAVPFFSIQAALLGRTFIDFRLVLATAVILVIALTRQAIGAIRHIARPTETRNGWVALALAVPLAGLAWLYYTDAEFLLSLASYLHRGEAKCFYMQTFVLTAGLNPSAAAVDLPKFYGIISTPGNALFTAGLLPVLGKYTFHVLFATCWVLIYLFVFLTVSRWTARPWIAVGAAWFAVVNPYMLSVEVLDRNVIACALGAGLLYTVWFHREKYLLHGLLFGITAGTGLRFLPLMLAAPIALIYVTENAPKRAYALCFAGGLATFAFNLPHLFYQGFHSLGEARPFTELLVAAFTELPRTPFVPYPNAVLYAISTLDYLGYLAAALILVGAGATWVKDRRFFLALTVAFLGPYLVLTAQRDWIEVDKMRILLSAFFPLAVFFGQGVATLLTRERIARHAGLLALALVLVVAVQFGLGHATGQLDATTYSKKPVYQTESAAYIGAIRRGVTDTGVLPNFHRLFEKPMLVRKQVEESALRYSMFAADNDATPLARQWYPPTAIAPPAARPRTAEFVNVEIDLAALTDRTKAAARLAPEAAETFLNLEDESGLLDIYYKEVAVPWQFERLPVAINPGNESVRALNELTVELNAFKSFGRDEVGFERVNLINMWVIPALRQRGFDRATTALPQTDDEPRIVIRAPKDMTVIVRNWVVDAKNGTPFRISSWRIRLGADGHPDVEFFPMEPESYL